MGKLKLYLSDLGIGALLALLPGIRCFENWLIHEYALLSAVYPAILYQRHRVKRPQVKIG